MPKRVKEMERSTSPVKKPRRPVRQVKQTLPVITPKKRTKKEPKHEVKPNPKKRKSFDHPIFDGLGTPGSSPKNAPVGKKKNKKKEPSPPGEIHDENDKDQGMAKQLILNPNHADPNIEEEAPEFIC